MNPFAPAFGHAAKVVGESDKGALLANGKSSACGLLESVKVSYIQKLPSQEERERDKPVTKRRKIDHAPQVSTVAKSAKKDAAAKKDEEPALEHAASSADKEHPADDEQESDYETDSNWGGLEEVQQRLKEYDKSKQSVKGYEKWTKDQAKLHTLLALRGCWPMFKHSWALDFSTRNIYPTVFAPAGTRKRVTITSRKNDFRATRALEAIFDLSPLIYSYRQSGIEEKIGVVLKKALKRYINWAAYDAGVEDRAYVSTLEVYEFNPRKWAAKARASKEAAIKTEPASEGNDWETDGEEVNTDPISDEVEKRLRRLAARHRAALVTPESRDLSEHEWTYKEQPPLLFAFVILQHMVMIVSTDPSRPDNEIIVFSELDMSRADQWLWNALAIALPVHMARDALWERRERLPVVERLEVDDPDL